MRSSFQLHVTASCNKISWICQMGLVKQIKCPRTCAKCALTQSLDHPGICLPLKHSIVSNDSVCGQRMPWSDYADAQADLGLRCPHMPEETFLHGGPDDSSFTHDQNALFWSWHGSLFNLVVNTRVEAASTFEPGHSKSYKIACLPSDGSDQPAYLRSMGSQTSQVSLDGQ